MGKRLLIAVALVGLVLPVAVVQAETFASCWVDKDLDPFGRPSTITRCRISGGTVIDYASDTEVPSVLYPQTGADINGQCWYYTSAITQYVILIQYANGDADIGYDPDPASPGGLVAIGPTLARCTSEPSSTTDPAAEAWDYVMQYIHDPPTPNLNPKPGDGVTGMDTYVGVPVPDTHTASLSAGGTALDVYIEVSAVILDWGDGETDSYPPSATALAGYPDGLASHVYEVKDGGVPITVSYDWTARWRLVGGSWEALAVPNTSTTIDYPISEIVSVLTG